MNTAIRNPRPPASITFQTAQPLVIFLCMYTLTALTIMYLSNHLPNLFQVIFSEHDAQGYRAITDSFFGEEQQLKAHQYALRPFLFPAFLSLYKLANIPTYIAVQWVINLASFSMMYFTLIKHWLSPRQAVVLLVLVALFYPSLTFLTLHALTETLSIFCCASAVHFIVRSLKDHCAYSPPVGLLFLAAATCSKPAFLPFMLIWAIFVLYRLLTSKFKYGYWLLPTVVLLGLQAIYSVHFAGKMQISSAGEINFETRFFPAVYGFQHWDKFVSYKDPRAIEARRKLPTAAEQLAFVLNHPASTAKATWYLLRKNLTDPSQYPQKPDHITQFNPVSKTLTSMSKRISKLTALLHLAGLCALAYLLLRRLPRAEWPLLGMLTIFLYSILLPSVLAYFQGDRLVIVAIPIWLTLYVACFTQIRATPTAHSTA